MKINELFILHRDVETRYKRAVEELIRSDYMKDEAEKEGDSLRKEVAGLRKEVYKQEMRTSDLEEELEMFKNMNHETKEREILSSSRVNELKAKLARV